VTLPNRQKAWLITRYDDVLTVLKDDQRFIKNKRNALSKEQMATAPWVPAIVKPLTHTLLDVDGSDHSRMRSLVHKAFTPQRVEAMESRIQAVTDGLLDEVQRKGKFDLIADFALPLPLTVICDLFGVSPEDRVKFGKWARAFMEFDSQGVSALFSIPKVFAILRFMRRLIEGRRVSSRDDLLSALIQAEESGDKLNADELLSIVFVLLIAGHETTLNLIGSGALALLENPDQLALLREKPELIKSAVEEIVRYVNPVEHATERYAAEDVVIHDVTIRKGEMILAVLASANRDESRFVEPDRFDIQRQDNKHLGFGQGVHYCVGAPLARLEGQIAIMTLLKRMPDLRLDASPETLRWRVGLTTRGLQALPVAF
jgi:cytochrome P450 PksS